MPNSERLKSLLDFTKRHVEDLNERRKQVLRATRLADLNRRFYKCGGVKVPFPSIAALQFIEEQLDVPTCHGGIAS